MVEGAGCPGRRRVVTGAALRRRHNMRRRLDLRILRNIGTAMAERTAGQSRMAHGSRRPGGITLVVAGVALTGHRDVRSRLGQGINCDISTTVTGRTVANRHRSCRCRMAHQGRAERSSVLVTGIALSRRRNMRRRLGLRSRSVVACRTLADCTRIMHEGRRRPRNSGFVASITLRGGCDVCGRFDLGIDRQIAATVAGRTVICSSRRIGSGVVHRSWSESNEIRVTGIAGRIGWQMGS